MSDGIPDDLAVERDVVLRANALAREFYELMGYVVAEGHRFDQARHPQERLCWSLAVLAYECIAGTDVADALAQIEDNADA